MRSHPPWLHPQRALCVRGPLANNGKRNHGEYQMFGKRVFSSLVGISVRAAFRQRFRTGYVSEGRPEGTAEC
ncbi:UNVERIFIED_CONTAM: hypothetical protein FKN15_078071 [Acipenser sinensis]